MEHFFTPECEALLAQLPHARPRLSLKDSLAGEAVRLTRESLRDETRLLLVADVRTQVALGARLALELSAHYFVETHVLADPLLPTAELAQELSRANTHAYIAVGSGTISDLCKAASAISGRPYLMWPTAPSMNGYTSANASLWMDGKKQSLPAHLPLAVLCEMEVIANAPARLCHAGLGDSLARSTAQADWLLAHLTQGTPYDERPFQLTAPYEPRLHENPADAHTLMEILLLSGFGMTLAGGSMPASQGEHMIVHHYEALSGDHRALHGEAVGVAVLTMARLQESLLPALPVSAQEKISHVMLPSTRLEAILKSAGCPTTPEELGWDAALYAQATRTAHTTRDRYTFLNLAYS